MKTRSELLPLARQINQLSGSWFYSNFIGSRARVKTDACKVSTLQVQVYNPNINKQEWHDITPETAKMIVAEGWANSPKATAVKS
jgi:hypothetical protein